MKNYILIALVVATTINATAQNNWNLGVQGTCGSNSSTFSDGSPNASALFTHGKYKEMSLGLVGRYFMGKHWSIQSGVGVGHIGFNYGIAKDYSLSQLQDHYTRNKVAVSVIQIPLIGIFTSKPNCRNVRAYVGAGANIMGHSRTVDKTKEVSISTQDKSATPDYINQTVNASPFLAVAAQFVWGVERILKQGNIMQFGFVANKGFTTIATSTVTYSVGGTQYSHTFSNSGNYMGMTMNYYFRPFKKK